MRWEPGPWNSHHTLKLLEGSRQELESVLASARGFQIRFTADLHEPVVQGALPLLPGARLVTPEGVHEVEAVDRLDGTLRVRTSFQGNPQGLQWTGLRGLTQPLVNEARQEFLRPFPVGGFSEAKPEGLVASTPHWFRGETAHEYLAPDGVGNEWFDDAALLIIGMKYVGSIEMELTREITAWPDWDDGVRVDSIASVSPPGS